MRSIVASVLILVFAVSCQAQTRETVSGNNNVITTEREPGNFSGLKVSTGIDVYLKQGDKTSLKIEADENLHEYIITEVKGDILHIYTIANIRKASEKKVYLTMKEIRSLRATSAGDIIGETPVKTDDIEINVSSAGDIKLELYTGKVNIQISSSGNVTLSGEAGTLDAELSSAGNLNAFDMKVKKAEITVSSAGDADVFVTENLHARASSAGNIHYTGDPKHIDVQSSSAGRVHKR